jgi:DNA-binding CsgD family transcriptional regulator
VEVRAVLDAMDDPLARALSLRVQGLVSDDVDAGIALLASALDAHTLGDDPFEHARTHLLRGERLRRARRRGDARRELGEAARMFGAMGAVPWVARAESELRAAGGTASGRAAPGRPGGRVANGRPVVVGCGPDVDGLTPQELAVATAVAAGASNREVAEHLFLSPRTVEYHLGNVYRKLGVHGRGALGVRLRVDDGDS